MNDIDIQDMSLDEKIGQLLVFGFDATDVNDHALRMIEDKHVGNVILFARNVDTPEQLFNLNQALQKTIIEMTGLPALICIDQEGGMVTRIKEGATFFPGAMTIAASHDPENSYRCGKMMGEQLRALGINMNLAPSLDINNNPHNPVIGVRSFGDTPQTVMTYGLPYIRGLQENVIATAKHFPGHGDTSVDSHLDLPRVDKTMSHLESMELRPFKAAVKAGVRAIMSSHIDFPALTEEGRPATLSSACLTGLLRKKWEYEGLIITDCMQMKAIQAKYTTEKGALMAIEAGADLVCVSHSETLQSKAVDHIKHAVLSGRLPEETINERVKRVLMHKRRFLDVDETKTYADVKNIIENRKADQCSLDVVRHALTKIRGGRPDTRKHTLVIASEPSSTSIADEEAGTSTIISAIRQAFPSFDAKNIDVNPTHETMNDLSELARTYEQIIFCSYNANIYDRQQALMKRLMTEAELFVIAMRNPYDSLFVPGLKHLTALYEYTPNAIRVLIEYLNGETDPSGVLPVAL